MSQKSKEREELEKAIKELKRIQKGTTAAEVVDAIIDKIKEQPADDEKVAKPQNFQLYS